MMPGSVPTVMRIEPEELFPAVLALGVATTFRSRSRDELARYDDRVPKTTDQRGHASPTRSTALRRWFMRSFMATVVVPIAVLVIVLAINNVSISPTVLFRRGELFLISLGLLGASVGIIPTDSTDDHPWEEILLSLSIWTLVIAAVCWGSINALAIANKSYAVWIPTWIGGVVLAASSVLAVSSVVATSVGGASTETSDASN
jgi:hypothetical protein